MDLMSKIKASAKAAGKCIVLPEGNEERTLKAADIILQEGLAKLILLGNAADIKKLAAEWGLKNIDKATIIDPLNNPKKEFYAQMLCEIRKSKGMQMPEALKLVEDPLYLGTLLIKNKEADGEVAGARNATGDVLRPAFQIVKTLPGISVVSGAFIMVFKDKKWGDDDIFVSEISNGRNTRLELLPPSFATAHFDDVPHAHSILKSRRDFTSRHVKYKSQFRTQALMSVLYYLRLAALATSIAMAYTNLAVVAAAAFIFLLTWLPTMLTTFRNCYLLRLPLLFFSTPLFIVWRPIVNVAYWIKGLFTYKNNYTSLLN